MTSKVREIVRKGRRRAAGAVEKLETAFYARQGRKAVRAKARRAAQLAGKAAKAGLAVGAVTAALVVRHETRKRRDS